MCSSSSPISRISSGSSGRSPKTKRGNVASIGVPVSRRRCRRSGDRVLPTREQPDRLKSRFDIESSLAEPHPQSVDEGVEKPSLAERVGDPGGGGLLEGV